ncbi:MAG: acetyl esterase/lipase [Flammeovirgaceae bacterium]|jgi:acetyl esterase/lipase
MKQSFTYYLTLFVLKLKGLKKIFSESPVDFEKVRKEDVHNPKSSFLKKNTTRKFKVSATSITEIKTEAASDKLLIFVHGGAFISGPAQHHWDSIEQLAKQTNYTIWMCDYPKAPESDISEMSENMDLVYSTALEKYQPEQITFIGDSAGATLITTLIQRLIKKNIELPSKLILISPVMDASMSNPAIEEVDKVDPMLSKAGILSAKIMCAKNLDLKNEMISPLYGSFEGFPKTILFLAGHDITYPDQKLALEKFNQAKVTIELIDEENMPHIWPLLPVMHEAKVALKQIIERLNG